MHPRNEGHPIIEEVLDGYESDKSEQKDTRIDTTFTPQSYQPHPGALSLYDEQRAQHYQTTFQDTIRQKTKTTETVDPDMLDLQRKYGINIKFKLDDLGAEELIPLYNPIKKNAIYNSLVKKLGDILRLPVFGFRINPGQFLQYSRVF